MPRGFTLARTTKLDSRQILAGAPEEGDDRNAAAHGGAQAPDQRRRRTSDTCRGNGSSSSARTCPSVLLCRAGGRICLRSIEEECPSMFRIGIRRGDRTKDSVVGYRNNAVAAQSHCYFGWADRHGPVHKAYCAINCYNLRRRWRPMQQRKIANREHAASRTRPLQYVRARKTKLHSLAHSSPSATV